MKESDGKYHLPCRVTQLSFFANLQRRVVVPCSLSISANVLKVVQYWLIILQEVQQNDGRKSKGSPFFSHMHRKLKIVPSLTCPCGEEDQTTKHVLQRCYRHQPERIAQWPSANPLHQKGLGGPEEDHQLHHCCWTSRVGEREEEDYI